MNAYAQFLESKRHRFATFGFAPVHQNAKLYEWQQRIVDWAIWKGRGCLFEDCGLGKTPQQLAWAQNVVEHRNKPVLVLAPLAVSRQTQREGEKFGYNVHIVRNQGDVRTGINIANYEMLQHFDPDKFAGIVLDESSILKNYDGKYRRDLTEFSRRIEYRLAATATPAPNDWIELLNHAEWVGDLRGKEALALYFRQDGNTTHAWRLKNHAVKDFWDWVASWCRAITNPSDLGYEDSRFTLPPLHTHEVTVDGKVYGEFLFPVEAQTLQERRKARADSVPQRVAMVADLVNDSRKPWLVWCNLNSESKALADSIPGAVEIRGDQDPDFKAESMLAFSAGDIRVLVTKPRIAGYGMNWQHCNKMAFVGLSDSWEQYYQAIRRCWRYGQTQPVDAHIVISENEGAVLANIQRKDRQARAMMKELTRRMVNASGN